LLRRMGAESGLSLSRAKEAVSLSPSVKHRLNTDYSK